MTSEIRRVVGLLTLSTAGSLHNTHTVTRSDLDQNRFLPLGVSYFSYVPRSNVVRLVLTEGLPLVAASASTRYVASLLFGVAPHDVRTIVGAASVVIVIAASAALVPAWRASRIDPLEALRHE